jgi:hypothetical protein
MKQSKNRYIRKEINANEEIRFLLVWPLRSQVLAYKKNSIVRNFLRSDGCFGTF